MARLSLSHSFMSADMKHRVPGSHGLDRGVVGVTNPSVLSLPLWASCRRLDHIIFQAVHRTWHLVRHRRLFIIYLGFYASKHLSTRMKNRTIFAPSASRTGRMRLGPPSAHARRRDADSILQGPGSTGNASSSIVAFVNCLLSLTSISGFSSSLYNRDGNLVHSYLLGYNGSMGTTHLDG